MQGKTRLAKNFRIEIDSLETYLNIKTFLPSLVNKDSFSNATLVMGTHAVEELLRYAPEKIVHLFTVSSKKSEIVALCAKHKIPISYVSKQDLTKMTGSESHQSLVAKIKPRKFFTVKEFLQTSKETSFVLLLDQIFDPQNFGALLRCAECFGVSAVVWSKNRGVDMTAVVTKASCGASELLPLIRVSNLVDSVELFKEAGFEIVVSLLDASAQSAYLFSYSPKTVLVIGSEAEGVQPLLRKKADQFLYLPMRGKLESLNVAQAATALLTLWQAGI